VVKKKAFWDQPNPKKRSKKLTPAQKTAAKKRAKAAGRPYPNLVDSAWASRKKK
jgi:catalase (peroxidase I)